jgi:hypothetical protein
LQLRKEGTAMKNRVTFKTIRGKHIVKVDGKETVFDDIWDAWEFIYSVHSRRAREKASV